NLRVSRRRVSACADGPAVAGVDHEAMKGSYAIVWSENGASHAGKLEVAPWGLYLEGCDVSREVPFADLVGVHVGRSSVERLDGRPVLVIERWSGDPIRIATVGELATLLELADGIADAQPRPGSGRFVVVA